MQQSKRSLKFALATLVFLAGSLLAQAQEEEGGADSAAADGAAAPAKKGKKGQGKTTQLNFEDELIQGEAKKPELFYLLQRKQFNFKKLIKLRDDFLPEMRSTSEELRRGGGTE